MIVKEMHYIFPPRPTTAVPRNNTQIYADLGWIAQLKFNDSRCLIKLCADGSIELWNRHGEMMRSYDIPENLQKQLNSLRDMIGSGYHLLDGGLLHNKHKAIKNTIVIWDILVLSNNHLVHTTYKDRYDIIAGFTNQMIWKYGDMGFGTKVTKDIFIPDPIVPANWEQTWEQIDKINYPFLNVDAAGPLLEGLVFKNPNGILDFGFKEKNNSDWISRSRVSTGRHIF